MSRSASKALGPVVIVGGGNAGVSIAARLRRRGVADVTIVEPRQEHVYAPLQSHIAGGVANRREVVRPQAKVTPRGGEMGAGSRRVGAASPELRRTGVRRTHGV
ncbi:FAD-dependent oxidoreductase [Microbacterium hydrocarbonoxydans]|nr:FAD-dependent oxidoreductase [Microbacterium hydrocarbonoxydans]